MSEDRYAPHGHCPVFMCGKPLPGRNAVVCADHYFDVPAETIRTAMRMKIRARTETDVARRATFASQAQKHQQAIVRRLQEGRAER